MSAISRSQEVPPNAEPSNRRDEIMQITARLFAEQGFHNTSMREVALASGVSKATLYHYFTAKEDILQAILTNGIQRLLNAASLAKSEADPETQMRALIRAHTANIDANLNDLKVFLFEQRVMQAGAAKFAEYLEMRRQYDAIFADIIRRGQRAKVFRTGSPKLISYGILGIFNWMVQWYQPHERNDLAAVTKLFEDMALDAVKA